MSYLSTHGLIVITTDVVEAAKNFLSINIHRQMFTHISPRHERCHGNNHSARDSDDVTGLHDGECLQIKMEGKPELVETRNLEW